MLFTSVLIIAISTIWKVKFLLYCDLRILNTVEFQDSLLSFNNFAVQNVRCLKLILHHLVVYASLKFCAIHRCKACFVLWSDRSFLQDSVLLSLNYTTHRYFLFDFGLLLNNFILLMIGLSQFQLLFRSPSVGLRAICNMGNSLSPSLLHNHSLYVSLSLSLSLKNLISV